MTEHSTEVLRANVARFRERIAQLREEIGKVVVGHREVIDGALTCMLAGSHALLEGVPGLGKTVLVKTMAEALALSFSRVQFTPDLMPADILGTMVIEEDAKGGQVLEFRRGPIFANIVLADEINRASPRTQSALLEAMNEGQVSLDGQTRPLPKPFFVLATQNPQDFVGTFPLPESQLDRFMVRLRIGYPPPQVEARLLMGDGGDRAKDVPTILDPERLVALQQEVERVAMDAALAAYLQAILSATRTAPSLSLGASTRAGINLARAARARALLRGRAYVIADDVHDLAVPVLAHRVRLASQAEGYAPTREEAENALREIVARVPVPV